MKPILKLTVVFTAMVLMVPEADAVFGVRRRCVRRTAVVVGSTTASASAYAAQSQHQ